MLCDSCYLQAVSVTARVFGWLSTFLPSDMQQRFVAEVLGELSDCDRRWERTCRLMSFVGRMPQLAWVVHSEKRRGPT